MFLADVESLGKNDDDVTYLAESVVNPEVRLDVKGDAVFVVVE